MCERMKRGEGNGRNGCGPPNEKECRLDRSATTDLRKRSRRIKTRGTVLGKIRIPAGYETQGLEMED
jgi:hypothetical protein